MIMLKKFFILTGALCLVFCGLPSTNIYALEEDSIVNIEYLDAEQLLHILPFLEAFKKSLFHLYFISLPQFGQTLIYSLIICSFNI